MLDVLSGGLDLLSPRATDPYQWYSTPFPGHTHLTDDWLSYDRGLYGSFTKLEGYFLPYLLLSVSCGSFQTAVWGHMKMWVSRTDQLFLLTGQNLNVMLDVSWFDSHQVVIGNQAQIAKWSILSECIYVIKSKNVSHNTAEELELE